MERLTERKYGNIVSKREEETGISCSSFCNDCSQGTGNCKYVKAMVEKLAEYEDLEEQGLLPKLPCKVGDTVYFISERTEKQGRRKAVTEFVDKGIVDNITLGSTMIPQITVCNDENIWTTFDSIEDFGKTVFLTQAEAKEALKGMKNE